MKSSEEKEQAESTPFFRDKELYFEFIRVISKALEHGADIGEALYAAGRIREGELSQTLASWHQEWKALAERIERVGDDCSSRGHAISARDAYLRATEYYRTADFFLHDAGRYDDPEILSLAERWVDCFNKARVLFDPAFERIEIPYEGTTLPGYFMPRGEAEGKAPTVIMHQGFDGTAEELVVQAGFDAVRRGYNFLAFEGPGQGQALRRRRLFFRHDWEKVVTPVIDYALAREQVDPERLVLYGVSMGGYLAPRAAAFEPRITACVANGGVFDVFDANTAPAGGSRDERARLVLDEPAEIDRLSREAAAKALGAYWGMTHGMFAFGAATPAELLKKQLDWTLADCAAKIRCPTLIIDVEKEQFFGSQARRLYQELTCSKSMIVFRSDEGAELHCQVGAQLLSNQRIFGWIDETLAAGGGARSRPR